MHQGGGHLRGVRQFGAKTGRLPLFPAEEGKSNSLYCLMIIFLAWNLLDMAIVYPFIN